MELLLLGAALALLFVLIRRRVRPRDRGSVAPDVAGDVVTPVGRRDPAGGPRDGGWL